jgi:hypothetical protein
MLHNLGTEAVMLKDVYPVLLCSVTVSMIF